MLSLLCFINHLTEIKDKMCVHVCVYLTHTVAVCVLFEAGGAGGFGVAPERPLCVHTLEPSSTVMESLRTLVDVCRMKE